MVPPLPSPIWNHTFVMSMSNYQHSQKNNWLFLIHKWFTLKDFYQFSQKITAKRLLRNIFSFVNLYQVFLNVFLCLHLRHDCITEHFKSILNHRWCHPADKSVSFFELVCHSSNPWFYSLSQLVRHPNSAIHVVSRFNQPVSHQDRVCSLT